MDLEFSRDYKIKAYRASLDPRFRYSFHEGLFAEALYFISTIFSFATAYLLCPVDSSQMTYTLGFPTWFFVSTCIYLLAWLIMIVYNFKYSKAFSFSARVKQTEDSA